MVLDPITKGGIITFVRGEFYTSLLLEKVNFWERYRVKNTKKNTKKLTLLPWKLFYKVIVAG